MKDRPRGPVDDARPPPVAGAFEDVRGDVGVGDLDARMGASVDQAVPLAPAARRAYPPRRILRAVRLGVLTGGGDCPGLNAVIRAIVRKGVADYGHEFVGYRDGWRGPLEGASRPLEIADVRGILPRGGTILGSSRTNPLKEDDGIDRVAGQPRARRRRRPDRDRRRGHARRRDPAARGGGRRRRRAEDDRQRPRRHRLHLRLRHRGQHRDGLDRPPAHHGREPQAHADRRGHGPPRRLDRRPRRPRRRRQRDPHPRAAIRPRRACAPTSRPASRASTRRSSSSRRAPSPRAGCRSSTKARPTPSATHASAGSDNGSRPRSRSAPATRPGRPCSATSSGAGRPPPSTASSRPDSGSTPSTRRTKAAGAR